MYIYIYIYIYQGSSKALAIKTNNKTTNMKKNT